MLGHLLFPDTSFWIPLCCSSLWCLRILNLNFSHIKIGKFLINITNMYIIRIMISASFDFSVVVSVLDNSKTWTCISSLLQTIFCTMVALVSTDWSIPGSIHRVSHVMSEHLQHTCIYILYSFLINIILDMWYCKSEHFEFSELSLWVCSSSYMWEFQPLTTCGKYWETKAIPW